MGIKKTILVLVFFLQACGGADYSGFSASYVISGASDIYPPVHLHYETNTNKMRFYEAAYADTDAASPLSELLLGEDVRSQTAQALSHLGRHAPSNVYKDGSGAAATDGVKVTLTLYADAAPKKTVIVDTTNLKKVPTSVVYLYHLALRKGLH